MANTNNTYCIICHQTISVDSWSASVMDCMRPVLNPELTVYKFLQSITNFNQLEITQVPQKACQKCYQNATKVLDFQTQCNKTVENIKMELTSIKIVLEENIKDEVNLSDDELPAMESIPECSLSAEESDFLNEDETVTRKHGLYVGYIAKQTKKKKLKKHEYNRHQAERIECPDCHKFYRRDYMKIHNRISHTGERPYKCKFCPKDFNIASSLSDHNKMHLDERPHLCTICGARFRKKTVLDGHTLLHTGERPYACEVCGKTFSNKGRLREHVTTHSDAKPFACMECPKRFRLNKLLKQHMVTHAKIKPIECTFCGKRFTQRHVLRTHQAKSCQGPGNPNENEATVG